VLAREQPHPSTCSELATNRARPTTYSNNRAHKVPPNLKYRTNEPNTFAPRRVAGPPTQRPPGTHMCWLHRGRMRRPLRDGAFQIYRVVKTPPFCRPLSISFPYDQDVNIDIDMHRRPPTDLPGTSLKVCVWVEELPTYLPTDSGSRRLP
jgi:hypothetical protein